MWAWSSRTYGLGPLISLEAPRGPEKSLSLGLGTKVLNPGLGLETKPNPKACHSAGTTWELK